MEARLDNTKSTRSSWPRTVLMEDVSFFPALSLPRSSLGVKLQEGLEWMNWGRKGVIRGSCGAGRGNTHHHDGSILPSSGQICTENKKEIAMETFTEKISSGVGGQMRRHYNSQFPSIILCCGRVTDNETALYLLTTWYTPDNTAPAHPNTHTAQILRHKPTAAPGLRVRFLPRPVCEEFTCLLPVVWGFLFQSKHM